MPRDSVTPAGLSKVMLGTVQLGQTYGVANRLGKPSYEEARDIIACAYEAGVNCLDTAAGYGDSEEVIGRALAELGIAGECTVVTKVSHLPEGLSPAAANRAMEDCVTQSMHRLRLERLPLVLFHVEQDFRYIDALQRVKQKGLVDRIGVSTMTPEATRTIVGSRKAQAIQIPTSIVDRRFSHSGIVSDAAAQGVLVFVRSIYLQGLILMADEDTPRHLSAIIPVRKLLRALASEAGMSLVELAMRYVMGLAGVCSVVIGVESVGQMSANAAVLRKGPLPPDMMEKVTAAVPDLPDDLLTPHYWPRLAATMPA